MNYDAGEYLKAGDEGGGRGQEALPRQVRLAGGRYRPTGLEVQVIMYGTGTYLSRSTVDR